jgi:hypothetical protein
VGWGEEEVLHSGSGLRHGLKLSATGALLRPSDMPPLLPSLALLKQHGRMSVQSRALLIPCSSNHPMAVCAWLGSGRWEDGSKRDAKQLVFV